MMILGNAARVLAEKTVKEMEANEEQCEYWLERSAALAMPLRRRSVTPAPPSSASNRQGDVLIRRSRQAGEGSSGRGD